MEDEPSGVEEQTDSVDDILTSLKQTAKTLELNLLEARVQMRLVQKKVAAEVVLQPKAKARAWLQKRERPVTADIEEFFEWFLEEHALEDRLDLTDRMIQLNADGQHLFGLAKEPVAFVEVLDRLARVYG